MPKQTKTSGRWNRKSAEQAVVFYTGLIARGIGLTADEQRDLTTARQFLRSVRKGTRNPFQGAIMDENENIEVSPLYDEKYKAQRWVRDARTIYKRTGKKVVASKVEFISKTNPANVKLIYGNVEQIKATKQAGRYKGQKFFHDFKSGAKAYGLDNGDILITTRKLK
jgi:hypothetical protein